MFCEDTANKRVITEEQRQQMETLRQEVLKGYEQIRNGQSIKVESDKLDDFFEDIIKTGTQRLEEKRGKLNGNS